VIKSWAVQAVDAACQLDDPLCGHIGGPHEAVQAGYDGSGAFLSVRIGSFYEYKSRVKAAALPIPDGNGIHQKMCRANQLRVA